MLTNRMEIESGKKGFDNERDMRDLLKFWGLLLKGFTA